MRHLIRIAVLVALTQSLPVAFAQSDSRTGAPTAQSNGENCGTPDNYKPCPPLPRNPLRTYPGPR
jgi:hypothetical protein